jgi:hypothetical protein
MRQHCYRISPLFNCTIGMLGNLGNRRQTTPASPNQARQCCNPHLTGMITTQLQQQFLVVVLPIGLKQVQGAQADQHWQLGIRQ